MTKLRGAVYYGKHGCEHQEFMQPVKMIRGTGKDIGTITMQIGDCHMTFNSVADLIAMITASSSFEDASGVVLAG